MTKEELFEFLKQEGVLRRFKRNIGKVIKGYNLDEKIYYESVFRSAEKYKVSPIKSAFTWDETPEGYDFWKKIAEKYLKTINYE